MPLLSREEQIDCRCGDSYTATLEWADDHWHLSPRYCPRCDRDCIDLASAIPPPCPGLCEDTGFVKFCPSTPDKCSGCETMPCPDCNADAKPCPCCDDYGCSCAGPGRESTDQETGYQWSGWTCTVHDRFVEE